LLTLLLLSGVTSDKVPPPLYVKPSEVSTSSPRPSFGTQVGLANGRVPVGSVALPGIHSVAAARAALTSHQPQFGSVGNGFTINAANRNFASAPTVSFYNALRGST
jgi:hypothetical protein